MTFILHLDNSIQSRCLEFVALYVGVEPSLFKYNSNVELDCKLPACILSGQSLVVSGLCHVSRQAIKFSCCKATLDSKKKKMESLLGYKQGCLKASAVVSNWTRFCEIEFPKAIEELIILSSSESSVTVPAALILLENEFSIPKKTPNAMKYFKGKKKDVLKFRDSIDLNLKPSESIESVLFNCGILDNEQPKKISKVDKITDMDSVISKSDIEWPFLAGLSLTVTDLLIISCFVELFSKVSLSFVKSLLVFLPKTEQWLLNCFSEQGFFTVVQKIWPNQGTSTNICKLVVSTESNIKYVSFQEKPGNPKQVHIKITKSLPRTLDLLKEHQISLDGLGVDNKNEALSWNTFPNEVDPSRGELNAERSKRKREQIENMISSILPLIKPGDRIVEFCAGGGHLGIVIAYLRPDCQIVLLDNKEESMSRACARIKSLGLKNVTFYLANLDYFTGNFDVGTTLHACGTATDLVLKKCLESRSSFVICPCCYGGIRSTTDILYPKSVLFHCLTSEDYHLLAHSADQTCKDQDSEYNKQGKNSMVLIDLDRKLHAMETGIFKSVNILTMCPRTCSPKNNMIVGSIS